MELFASRSSPFARQARIVLSLKGLEARVETVFTSPFADDATARRLLTVNPLNRIPALLLDDGTTVIDSPVICAFLDAIGTGPALLSQDGSSRLTDSSWIAAANGILDAAFQLVMERRRPAGQQSAEWQRRWQDNVERQLRNPPLLGSEALGMPEIAWLCAVDYLGFRLPDVIQVPPALIAWRAGFNSTPAVAATMPTD